MAAHMIARDGGGVIETPCGKTLYRPEWHDYYLRGGYHKFADTADSEGSSPICQHCRRRFPDWATAIDKERGKT